MKKSTIIYGLLIILITGTASAVNIGVSPASLTFDNMIRGGYSETTLFISTSGDDRLQIGFGISGPIKDWISFNETDFILEPRSTKTVVVYARPPLDAASDTYNGTIYMSAAPVIAINETGTGLGVRSGISIYTAIVVTGQQIESYKLLDLTVRDTEVNSPISIVTYIKNEGNVRARPKIHIDIYKENVIVKVIEYAEAEKEILPTKTERILFEINSTGLGIDNYMANVSVKENYILDDFNILEVGGLSLGGILERLTIKNPDIGVGEKTLIIGIFENTGNRRVSARLKIKALIGSEIIDTLEGEEMDVEPGEKVALEAFYTPQKSGRYIIQGSVVYSKRVTSPKEATLNVSGFNYLYLIIGIIIVAIAYIKRQKIRETLRRYVF